MKKLGKTFYTFFNISMLILWHFLDNFWKNLQKIIGKIWKILYSEDSRVRLYGHKEKSVVSKMISKIINDRVISSSLLKIVKICHKIIIFFLSAILIVTYSLVENPLFRAVSHDNTCMIASIISIPAAGIK